MPTQCARMMLIQAVSVQAYLLCSDIFVLLEAPQDEAAPATLITVIRLGIHNDGEDVAALFGAGSSELRRHDPDGPYR